MYRKAAKMLNTPLTGISAEQRFYFRLSVIQSERRMIESEDLRCGNPDGMPA
jgi:hypothetical protein